MNPHDFVFQISSLRTLGDVSNNMMIGILVDSLGIVRQIVPDALYIDSDHMVFVGGELRGFTPDTLAFIVPDTEQINEGEPLSQTPVILEALKHATKVRIAQSRWQAETGGCTLQGMVIHTDRESQAMLTGAALKSMQDPSYTCAWKTDDGFIELSAQEILGIADVVRQHVQGCFDKERSLNITIAAATTIEELRTITW